MRYIFRGSLVLILCLAISLLASADELVTGGGKKLTGKLVAVNREGVTFKTGEAEAKIPGKEIVVVDLGHPVVAPAKGAEFHEIELTDGTILRCSRYLVKGKKFEIELLEGPKDVAPPKFDLPMTAVFYACRRADDAKHKAEWRKMLQNRGKRDLYVIRQADGLNFVQGTLVEGDAEGTRLTFEKEDGGKESLLLSRATGGLVFNQAQNIELPSTLCKVQDVFGNMLVAQAVEMAGSGVKVTTVAGVVVSYPSAQGIAKLDYSQGNVAYLSDLTPQVQAPAIPPDEVNTNIAVPFVADKTPTNEPLRLDNVVYPKGLWIASDTVLTYTLNGDYRELKAMIGIHDQFGTNSTEAKVTIEADGKPIFSEVVKRKDKPKGVTLDIKNIQQLRILVESDSPFFNGSQAVLADARVQK